MNELGSILITGGAGFFGKAFVRHLLDNNLSDRICIYSRDEYKHAVMRDELGGDSRLRFLIGDVRDKERLQRACIGVDVVIAAAALKRIEVGNYAPDEMVKTNINGSQNIIDAAAATGVKKVVFLSSDKAYQGCSPYGQSKSLAESLFINANNIYGELGPKYSCVRYGNIWRSTGSILPRWEAMLKEGATELPVTDPDCTRFFMLIEEAVKLVLDTVDTMSGGEVNIPDWLPAYRVGDLVDALGSEAKITGLPDWEKKHESMNDNLCSEDARRMGIGELRGYINEQA